MNSNVIKDYHVLPIRLANSISIFYKSYGMYRGQENKGNYQVEPSWTFHRALEGQEIGRVEETAPGPRTAAREERRWANLMAGCCPASTG